MHSLVYNIPPDCTKEQFIVILDSVGFTHSDHALIEKDLTTIRGKEVRINAGIDKVVMSYSVPMPDRE